MKVLVGNYYKSINKLTKNERNRQYNVMLNKLQNIGENLLNIDSEESFLKEQFNILQNTIKGLEERKIKQEKEYNKFSRILEEIVECGDCEKEKKLFSIWKEMEEIQIC